MASTLNDFLNAKTSVTFGASATMVVAFTATLCSAFSLPSAIVGLTLSGLFALAQVTPMKDRLHMKCAFWAICTLVIFNAARGGNSTMKEVVDQQPAPLPKVMVIPESEPSASIIDLLVPSACAGSADKKNKDDGKYYLWKVDGQGRGVYTNRAGSVRVVEKERQTFDSWKWKK